MIPFDQWVLKGDWGETSLFRVVRVMIISLSDHVHLFLLKLGFWLIGVNSFIWHLYSSRHIVGGDIGGMSKRGLSAPSASEIRQSKIKVVL